MTLLRINTIPMALQSDFSRRVQEIAAELGIEPNWLMQVMWSESRLNPQAVNRQTGDPADPFTRAARRATGLLQFMPATARSLGTNNQAIFKMNALQQLELVRRYFLPWKGRMKSYYDVYSVVFFPALIGKPDTWVLQTSSLPAATIARQNPAVNINKDGKITVAEFKQYVFNSVLAAHRSLVFGQIQQAAQTAANTVKNNPGASGLVAGAVLVFLFFYSLTINSLSNQLL
ncbi:MAG TPA: transglycosylase SLT domain-containing protein [Lacibacter sp.]|nr:transglycosylase SLT domain-containing protein [Lacibacter sp.]HMO89568.1 transglycosylase SLT domain-containing protein [Lacibacter sp.]HMP87179.1 transglycosylase SLT domain-containing protein [Lacibacter sp.]